MIRSLLLVLVGYLIGSVSFSVLIVRLLTGADVRDSGSGNAGATNVLRVVGRGPGVAVLVLDVLKGVFPVMLGWSLEAPPVVVAAIAAATVVGHVYPVFFGLRGGKGVATAAGALGALAPLAFAGSLAAFAATVVVTRYVSLASIVAVAVFPVFVALGGVLGAEFPNNPGFVAACTLVPALIVWRHRGNIARLRAGTERRLGESSRRERS